MKQRSTTPASTTFTAKACIVAAAVLMAIATPIQMGQVANADRFDDQINAIRQEVSQYQAKASQLQKKANTLKNELARLGAEKSIIQSQINLSQAQYDKLIVDIAANEQKIVDNKDALGATIADMYVEDSISPLEMLASSNNIGDYVDKQSYRAAVSDQLQQTIDTINRLKAELEKQKIEVERVLTDQKNQRESLVAKEAERQEILNQTKGEEAAYQKLSNEKNAKIDSLRSQQAAEIAARAQQTGGGYTSLPGDGSRGGYPSLWANAPMNSYVDTWGMYSRQCVSYAAFKVQQAYGNMPYWGGIGNANEWGNNARAAQIKVSSTPAPGTVGVLYDGPYGHVAWVESVNSDGTINISHYNVNWSGEYAEWKNLSPSFFQEYIYFGG